MELYEVTTKSGSPVRMKNGEPFRYTSKRLAELGAKYLTFKIPKRERPLRVQRP